MQLLGQTLLVYRMLYGASRFVKKILIGGLRSSVPLPIGNASVRYGLKKIKLQNYKIATDSFLSQYRIDLKMANVQPHTKQSNNVR